MTCFLLAASFRPFQRRHFPERSRSKKKKKRPIFADLFRPVGGFVRTPRTPYSYAPASTDMASHQSCQAALGENVPTLHGQHHRFENAESQAAPRTSTTLDVGAFGLPVDDVITGITERLTVFNAVAIFRLVVDEAINVEATSSC